MSSHFRNKPNRGDYRLLQLPDRSRGGDSRRTDSRSCAFAEGELESSSTQQRTDYEAPVSDPWMSEKGERLQRAELNSLRSQLVSLQVALEDLVERVERLEVAESEKFSAVSSVLDPREQSAVSSAPSTGLIDPKDTEGRRLLAAEIGKFLGRAAQGDFRGSSGRDRLRVANRCYLVVKNFEGVALSTPLFTQQFSEVRRLCKRGNECGASVFIGLATIWEAKVAIRHSGLPVPASLIDG